MTFHDPRANNTHAKEKRGRELSPQVITIAYKLSSVLSAVHALVLLAALLFYRAYYTPSNSESNTMSVSARDTSYTREQNTCVC